MYSCTICTEFTLSSYRPGLMHSLFIPMQPVYLQLLCMHGLYVVHMAAGACSAKGTQPKSALGEVQLCIISSLQESCKQLAR